jgi:hypothetical protein
MENCRAARLAHPVGRGITEHTECRHSIYQSDRISSLCVHNEGLLKSRRSLQLRRQSMGTCPSDSTYADRAAGHQKAARGLPPSHAYRPSGVR